MDMTKTDELIARLSREPRTKSLSPTPVVVIGTTLAMLFALVLSIEWLKPRADLAPALLAENHIFLLKLVFTAGVVIATLPIVRDLSAPGRSIGLWSALAAVPFVMVLILALREFANAPAGEWSHHLQHASWLECLWQIPVLAIPAFTILVLCVRRLAPTDLARAGAYIGLAAGGIGATGYAFHCPDDSMAIVAVFYTLAILEMTMLGAIFGPQLLRWTAGRG